MPPLPQVGNAAGAALDLSVSRRLGGGAAVRDRPPIPLPASRMSCAARAERDHGKIRIQTLLTLLSLPSEG